MIETFITREAEPADAAAICYLLRRKGQSFQDVLAPAPRYWLADRYKLIT
jgi:hypothetical protein